MSSSTACFATCLLMSTLGVCHETPNGVSLSVFVPANFTITNTICNATQSASGDIGPLMQELREIKQDLQDMKLSLENGDCCRSETVSSGSHPTSGGTVRDCYDVQRSGVDVSGVYTIIPDGINSFEAFCDMDKDGGGWTVFQRREDGTVDFNRNWCEYKHGFGTPDGELWMGNDRLHHLTSQGNHEMRIDMVNTSGEVLYMKYDSFRISDEDHEYLLSRLEGFSGNTGYDYMADHAMVQFSTFDNDNDRVSGYCGRDGWWYNRCSRTAPLNGIYSDESNEAIRLRNSETGTFDHTLSFAEMKIRRVD